MIDVDPAQIARARTLSSKITDDVQAFIDQHTTVSVERSVLRLYGVDGVHKAPGVEIPLVNVVVDHVNQAGLLGRGVASTLASALKVSGPDADPQDVCQKIAQKKIDVALLPKLPPQEVESTLAERSESALQRLELCRRKKQEKLALYGDPPKPYKYLIVASGNIFEDVIQARAAVDAGADIIALIRSTAQSLLE